MSLVKENSHLESNGYFAWRNVSPDFYESYEIPAYLLNILTSPGKDAKILDFGCGFGQMLKSLKKKGFRNIEGADIDRAAISHLNDLSIAVHDLSEEVDFYETHAAKYDFIIMSHVLEHFPKNEIIIQLRKIKNLLKDGGGLIVMVPNAQANTGCYWAYEDFTHTTLFTSGSLYYVLRSAGYSQVEFLDVDCTAGNGPLTRMVRKLLLRLYRLNYDFWNKVTCSAFHGSSPPIFSYEIKALAKI